VISVFGSGACDQHGQTYDLAYRLGQKLAECGFVVATGGYNGVMEAASRGAAERGGHVIGIVLASSADKANACVREKIVVADWEARLRKLISIASGYVVCGGGTGTLVELAVTWEMMCKRLMSQRPLITLGGFWDPVVRQITSCNEGAGAKGFVYSAVDVDDALRVLESALR
jgi:uncharacterized protein (TIGR00725 family)